MGVMVIMVYSLLWVMQDLHHLTILGYVPIWEVSVSDFRLDQTWVEAESVLLCLLNLRPLSSRFWGLTRV